MQKSLERWLERVVLRCLPAHAVTHMQAAQLTGRDALKEGLVEEMARDSTVILLGEEVAKYDGAYKGACALWRSVAFPCDEECLRGGAQCPRVCSASSARLVSSTRPSPSTALRASQWARYV